MMAQPFDYTIASPNAAFQQAYAFGTALSERDKAQAEAARKAQRTMDAQAALKSIAENRTPENIAKNLLLFPELKEQVAASEAILSDAEKTSANQLRAEVLSLYKAGKADLARARLQTQAEAYKNTPGKENQAKAAETLLKTFDINPDSVILPMSIQLAQSDDKLYKALFDAGEKPTTFQQDFNFIKKTFGEGAAAEFAQFGRSGIVSIPLGDGRTYVGPPSMAPGAARWQQQPGMLTPTENPPVKPNQGIETILGDASGTKKITQEEADVVRQSLGKNGQASFEQWLTNNKIKVITRTGTAADGRRVVQYQDGTVEYGD